MTLVILCSANTDLWTWNTHGTDWIYQGGPDSTAVKNDPTYNEWGTLGSSIPAAGPWSIVDVRIHPARLQASANLISTLHL